MSSFVRKISWKARSTHIMAGQPHTPSFGTPVAPQVRELLAGSVRMIQQQRPLPENRAGGPGRGSAVRPSFTPQPHTFQPIPAPSIECKRWCFCSVQQNFWGRDCTRHLKNDRESHLTGSLQSLSFSIVLSPEAPQTTS